jgi:soluble lytic murein transglycosylase-like protein
MLTKFKTDAVVKTAHLALFSAALLTTAPLQAAPDNDSGSPYKLNAEPVKIPQIADPASSITPSQNPQLYQLEYKYRSPHKPLTVKAELPESIPAEITSTAQPPALKYTDSNMLAILAKQPFSNEIALAANAVALDPSLVHAVIYVESRYRHNALSPKGAVGLMQVLPDTAARYGLREAVHIPKGNIKAGTLYLRDLMVMFDNRLDLVLAAYNAGEGAVKKYSRQIPPYPETRHYVKAVMAKYALNVGASESSAMHNASNVSKPSSLLPVIQQRTKYLSGTNLVIPNEAFTLNR